MTVRVASQLLLWAVVASIPARGFAVRPFVTDDARVVGNRLAQLETWVLVDREVVEHTALAAIGPTPWIELTAGFVHGGIHSKAPRAYSITGPVIQAKGLLSPVEDNGWPGLAVAAGVLPPVGTGEFVPAGWGGFGYGALSQSIADEALLLHLNLGFVVADGGRAVDGAATGGLGAQARLLGALHAVGEVYFGDPYDPSFRVPASQLGFRYIFSDEVQVDGTFGSTLREREGLSGHRQTEQWLTLGIRIVSQPLW